MQPTLDTATVPPSGLLRLADAVAEDGRGKIFEVGYLGLVDV